MDKNSKIFYTAMTVVIVCFFLIAIFSGFSHETMKFKTMLLTIVVIFLVQHLILDVIYFAARAFLSTFQWQWKFWINKSSTEEGLVIPQETIENNRNYVLKLRIESLKSRLLAADVTNNEEQNLRYKEIMEDLWLFSKYFLLLLLLIVGTRDYLTYYNTATFENILEDNYFSGFGLKSVKTLEDIYKFTEMTLIESFNNGKDYNEKVIQESGWINFYMAKLLSVVRIVQLRQKSKKIGLHHPIFSTEKFLPHWTFPFPNLHYIDKYWRVYRPWLPAISFDGFLFSSLNYGHLRFYKEDGGYVVLLARSKQNSMVVLEFLKNQTWLDDYSAALIIDFTLYNVDSEIFSITRILIEQTPFGNVLVQMDIKSAELLMNFDNISWTGWIIFLLYLLQFIQFTKRTFLKAWHDPSIFRTIWYKWDIMIIFLNIAVILLILIRNSSVAKLCDQLHASEKLDFVDFSKPGQIDELLNLTAGFLIAMTTIRIWKVLQFARVFQLFTRTLSNAKMDMLSIALFILVFKVAYSICTFIVNGNNSQHFYHFMSSITTTVTFSIGFSQVRPDDLNHGGPYLGFILYALLTIVVTIILINIFITLIISHYGDTKKAMDQEKTAEDTNFFNFLIAEHPRIWRWYKSLFPQEHYEKPKRQTVKKYIEETLEKHEAQKDDQQTNIKLMDVDRFELVVKILKTQSELLRRQLLIRDIELDSDDEEVSQV